MKHLDKIKEIFRSYEKKYEGLNPFSAYRKVPSDVKNCYDKCLKYLSEQDDMTIKDLGTCFNHLLETATKHNHTTMLDYHHFPIRFFDLITSKKT